MFNMHRIWGLATGTYAVIRELLVFLCAVDKLYSRVLNKINNNKTEFANCQEQCIFRTGTSLVADSEE